MAVSWATKYSRTRTSSALPFGCGRCAIICTCRMARSAENTVGAAVAGNGAGGRLANKTRAAQRSSRATAVSNAERRGCMIINVQPVRYQGQ